MIDTLFLPRSARRMVAAGLLAVGAAASSASAVEAQDKTAATPRQITVSGTGEASAKPDLAIIGLTVLRTAPTAGAGMEDANKAMAEVIEAVKALGIESRDLQTSGFQISPQYVYDNGQDGTQVPPKLVGYEVRNTVSVRIRDLAKIGAVLDKAVSLGVNEGNGIQFTIDDASALRTEARRKAVADAAMTAETLAEAAGVTLGFVVSIDVSSDAMPPVPMALQMARMASPAPKAQSDMAVESGENTVNASVQMVFAIEGGS